MDFVKKAVTFSLLFLLCNSFSQASTTYNVNGFQFTEYTDRSEWLTDVSGTVHSEDFNDYSLIPELSINSTNGRINRYRDDWYDRLTGNRQYETSFTFSQAANAFGGDWTVDTRYQGQGSNGLGIAIFFDLLSGSTHRLYREIPNDLIGFYGIILPEGVLFSSLHLAEGTQGPSHGIETYYLDDFVFNDPQPVPLPAAVWLFVTGIVTFSVYNYKRKAKEV
ncbi:MAG: hypothetical protein AB2746_14115 [Candidatus Thiodiazotropha taylori]